MPLNDVKEVLVGHLRHISVILLIFVCPALAFINGLYAGLSFGLCPRSLETIPLTDGTSIKSENTAIYYSIASTGFRLFDFLSLRITGLGGGRKDTFADDDIENHFESYGHISHLSSYAHYYSLINTISADLTFTESLYGTITTGYSHEHLDVKANCNINGEETELVNFVQRRNCLLGGASLSLRTKSFFGFDIGIRYEYDLNEDISGLPVFLYINTSGYEDENTYIRGIILGLECDLLDEWIDYRISMGIDVLFKFQ